MRPTRPLALFDDTHGQTHWSRTGFPSREWHTNLAGLAGLLFRRGLDCGSIRPHLLSDRLADARLLVLPTPTGYYNPAREQWEPLASSLLTAFEVREILRFLEGGGRLLAFAYRFGDAFTQTNLDSLFVPLGCQLNPDAVIDLTRLREMHPLRFYFDTPREALPLHWSVDRVATVRWRSLATFTLRQDAPVQPLAFSPRGRLHQLRLRTPPDQFPLATHCRGRSARSGAVCAVRRAARVRDRAAGAAGQRPQPPVPGQRAQLAVGGRDHPIGGGAR